MNRIGIAIHCQKSSLTEGYIFAYKEGSLPYAKTIARWLNIPWEPGDTISVAGLNVPEEFAKSGIDVNALQFIHYIANDREE